jgi:hypothetical protein
VARQVFFINGIFLSGAQPETSFERIIQDELAATFDQATEKSLRLEYLQSPTHSAAAGKKRVHRHHNGMQESDYARRLLRELRNDSRLVSTIDTQIPLRPVRRE